MKTKVMVTGHRVIQNADAVMFRLMWIIQVLGRRGIEVLGVSGGAMGADSLWARACFAADTQFVLEVPNRWYFKQYREDSAEEVQWLLANCLEVNHTVDRPHVDNWRTLWGSQRWWKDNFARNMAMINQSEWYIVVSDEDPAYYVQNPGVKGGTAACVRDLHRLRKENVLWVCPANPESVKQVIWS